MQELPKLLGINIRMMRRQQKISQDALALLCGLDRSYMGRVERGEVNVTVEKLYRIAQVLACEPAELLPTLELVGLSIDDSV